MKKVSFILGLIALILTTIAFVGSSELEYVFINLFFLIVAGIGLFLTHNTKLNNMENAGAIILVIISFILIFLNLQFNSISLDGILYLLSGVFVLADNNYKSVK